MRRESTRGNGIAAGVLLVGAALVGCRGGSEGESSGGSEGSGTSSGPSVTSTADTTDTSDGADSGRADSDTSTGGPPDPPPPSAACEERELPPRGGAEILVSPGPDATVMVDGQATTLRAVVASAASGDTILLADGEYPLPEAGPGEYTGLYFTTPDVTLRSQSGDPQSVVIDGRYLSQGDGSAPITIDATGIVVAHLTVRRSIFHLIHIWAGGDGALVHDVHMVDGGQQFLKSSVDDGTVDEVEVSCSSFVMTPQGRDNVWGYGPQDGGTTCYTGGIDTHNARSWFVHDSYFEGIYCDESGVPRPAHGQFPEQRDGMTYNGGLAEHGIHMWDSEMGTGHVIARNRIVDCARGIGIGLVDPVYGTTVVNNMVSSVHAASGEHDVGIIVERAVDTVVAHNSVVLTHPEAYPNGIEYRWAETSNLTLHGNLSNRAITARDGATAAESDEVDDADPAWLADPGSGDLHLVDCAAPGSAALHPSAPDDFDGEPRSDPTVPGADECSG
ncbi:MAG: hypothetical protein KC501_32145 [Myxococcales bacterium]|nr:hypothetical protein [Myxococcales bacterium]